MAKSIKDKNGREIKINSKGQPKKDRHALECCLSFVIVWVLIIGVGIGVTFFAGDYLLKTRLGQEKGVSDYVGDFIKFNDYRKFEKTQLDNTYQNSDADDFVTSLTDALFIKDISRNDIQNAIDHLVQSALEDNQQDSTPNIIQNTSQYLKDEQLAPLDIFIDILENNLDRTKISNYQDGTANEYFVSFSDKSLAAFVNDMVLNSLLSNQLFKDNINAQIQTAFKDLDLKKVSFSLDDFDYKDVIQIKQISFYKNGLGDSANSGVKLITLTNFNKVIDTITKKLNGNNLLSEQASGLAKFGADSAAFLIRQLTNILLPKKLYLCVDMPISESKVPTVFVNNLSQNLNQLSELPEIKEFLDVFQEDGRIGRAVNSLNELVPISDALEVSGNSGSLTTDMVGVMLELAQINYKDGQKLPSPQRSCSNDIYLALKGFIGADTQAAIQQKQQYDYTKFEFVKENGVISLDAMGNPIMQQIDKDAPIREITLIQDDYEDALLQALSLSYGLRTDTTFDTVFDMISGEGGLQDFIDLFDSAKLRDIVQKEAKGATITPKILSAILAKRMDSLLDQEADLGITLKYLRMFNSTTNELVHNLIEVGVELNLSALLPKQDEQISKILSALIPDSLFISVIIDITPSPPPEFEYIDVEFSIDRLSYEQTKRITNLINNLGVFGKESADSGLDQLLGDILLPIRDMISKMTDALPGLELGESGIITPNVYSAIAGVLARDSQTGITSHELEQNLKFLLSNDIPYSLEEDLSGLIQVFNNSFAINLDPLAEQPLSDLFVALNITSGQGEITDLVNIDSLKTLAFSQKTLDELRPAISGEMFAALIYQYIDTESNTEDIARFIPKDSISEIKFFTQSGRDMVSFSVILDLSVLLSFGSTDQTTDFISGLIGKVSISATLDISAEDQGRIQTEIILNPDAEQAAAKTEQLFDMLDKLSIDFSSDTLGSVKSTLDDSVRAIFSSMHDMGINTSIADNKLYLSDLFSIIDSILPAENKVGAQQLKNILEEIYINPDDTQNKWLKRDNVRQINSLQEEVESIIQGLNYEDMQNDLMAEITDSTIAGMIQLQAKDNFDGGINAAFILASSDTSELADSLRMWLKGFEQQDHLDADYKLKDYMVIKTEIDMKELGMIEVSSASTLLPEKMYVTLLFQLDGKTPSYVWYRVNNMTKSQQHDMFVFSGKSDVIEDILGDSGENNIGGVFFQELARSVFVFIDQSLHDSFDDFATAQGRTLAIDYAYKQNLDGIGKVVIRIYLE